VAQRRGEPVPHRGGLLALRRRHRRDHARFVVPRGITTLAGGTAAADATEFTLHAAKGEANYTIGENLYLAKEASTLSYDATITIGDDTWSYDETTMLKMAEFAEPFSHTDRNTLHRVG